MSYHATYTSFAALLRGLDSYIDDLIPYQVDRTRTPFPNLPLELREHIYAHVLPSHLTSLHPLLPFLGSNPTSDSTYSILNVNEATRIDAGLSYLRTRNFDVWSTASCRLFEEYLETFPGEQGFQSVRHLAFPNFCRHVRSGWFNTNIELMLRCSHLRTVSLTFHQSLTPDDCSVLVEMYRLEELLKMAKVEKIELNCVYEWKLVRGYSAIMETHIWRREFGEFLLAVMTELRDWLERGFEELGRKVVVVVVPGSS